MSDLGAKLERLYNERNTSFELSKDKPDPLLVVKAHLKSANLAEIALICALLSYGNAGQIVNTLQKLDFSLLESRQKILRADFPHYRFQSSDDIKMLFLAIFALLESGGIKGIFVESYRKNKSVIDGIHALIRAIRANLAQENASRGLDFLIGRIDTNSPLKRWNMLLRWLVRCDNIDFGLWRDCVDAHDLILPLDTHTFRISQEFGLLKRKSYDLQSALEITANLARFCPADPVKYDFALYRLGQNRHKAKK